MAKLVDAQDLKSWVTIISGVPVQFRPGAPFLLNNKLRFLKINIPEADEKKTPPLKLRKVNSPKPLQILLDKPQAPLVNI